MNIEALFNDLKTKDIICWGSGKHFKNITYPFLCESGLIDNLKGFLDTTGTDEVILDEIKNLDINSLTPIEALNTLCSLQSKLNNRWGL